MEIRELANGTFEVMADGETIGFGNMALAEDGDDFNYLESIEIIESKRNKGYGTKALYELERHFGEYYLTADNEDATRLYERIADEISQQDYDKFGFAIDNGYGVYKI